MTLLHAGSLESCDPIYDYKNFKINEKLIEDRINQTISLRYSKKLVGFIRALLSVDEDARPDFNTVLQMITSKVPSQVQTPAISAQGGSSVIIF